MENNELMDWLQGWFERFMGRFDSLDNNMENMSGRYHFLGGERFLDNQEVCQLLHVSKRTLQRYRSSGELPYQMLYHKTYYRESDVEAFIRKNFAKGETGEETEEDSGE